MSHRLLAHTADLGAEISAGSAAELYAESVALVRELLVGASPVAAREGRRIALAAGEEGERIFRFVRELVYLADAEGFLPAAVTLEADAAVVAGERFDPARHVAERQIKALTRHRFELAREDGGYRCHMVFDL